ncbi:MAG: helix-turn-helix domain-containing protein [Pseudomonadota bacterium]|nr:helix-turn-helix domain-containing protein [Pseudomonadota bacterium]
MIGDKIRKAREKTGLTQKELGKALGVQPQTVSQWEKNRRNPPYTALSRMQNIIGMNIGEAFAGPAPAADLISPVNPAVTVSAREHTAPWMGNLHIRRDLPVRGTVTAGSDGGPGSADSITEYIDRPPVLATARDAFAVWIRGDAMVPAYSPGEIVCVNPGRPAVPDDYVIVELQDSPDGPGQRLLKKFVRQTGSELVFQQHNPAQESVLDSGKIKALYRVMRWKELMGV